jgi:uncharacterized MAPEG superfamily protein
MTPEFSMLTFSAILGIIQLLVSTSLVVVQRGLPWATSNREAPVAPLTGLTYRLDRAFHNFKETFAFFVAAVLVAHFVVPNSNTSILGSQLYFGGRLAYVIVFAFGIPYLRTIVWTVSLVGICMVLSSVL